MKIAKKIMSCVVALALTATSAQLAFADNEQSSVTHISTPQQLIDISQNLSGSYILDNDIDLSGIDWTPIGNLSYSTDVDMTTGDMDMSKAFSGTFDGNNCKITNLNLTTKGDYMATGLFGALIGGSIKNFTVENSTANGHTDGTSDSQAVGTVVGYAMGGNVENVTVVNSTITGQVCVGGIVGGNMASVTDCTADNVKVNLLGDNDFSETNRIIQCDVAECGGCVVGGGFTGTVNNCTAKNSTVEALGNEPVGLGGISGCLQCMLEVKGNTVDNVTIKTAKGGHAIGGLCGYAGVGHDGDGTNLNNICDISGNNVNVTIDAIGATHIGGLVGTGLYYFGMEDRFNAHNNTIGGEIKGGTDISSAYGESLVGAVAGRATGCTVKNNDFSALKINGESAVNAIGKNTFMYESADQEDDSDGAELLAGLAGYTFKQLFVGGTFNSEYDKYWHDYTATIVGEKNADDVVAMTKASVSSEKCGKDADPEQQKFFCGFTNGLSTISFDGTRISGKDVDGNDLFAHNYRYIGFDKDTNFYIFESLDENSGEFTYFTMWSDTPETTGHIEFRYGSNKDELCKLYEGDYAFWMSAGLDVNATEKEIEDVIALFVLENMDYSSRMDGSVEQVADFVGSWNTTDDSNVKLVVTKDGNLATYINGEKISDSMLFAYDNDNDDNVKSGIFATHIKDEESKWGYYSIQTSDSNTTLTLTGVDENGNNYSSVYVKEIEKVENSSSTITGNSENDENSSNSDTPNGNATVSSNTSSKTDNVQTPATGSESDVGQVVLVMLIAGFVLSALVISKKRKFN